MTNYRLISLLNVFSKVSETAMHSKLSCHLHDKNILATQQHGFSKKISTENAAFRITKSIYLSLLTKKCMLQEFSVVWQRL